jgi:hypothetical protein
MHVVKRLVSFMSLPLHPMQRHPETCWRGGWVDSRADLATLKKYLPLMGIKWLIRCPTCRLGTIHTTLSQLTLKFSRTHIQNSSNISVQDWQKNVWATSWLRTIQTPWICVQKTFFQIFCFLTSIILVQVTCKHLVLKCLSYYCSLSSQGICNLPSFDNISTKTLTITCTLFNSLFNFTIIWQRGKCLSWTTQCYNWFLPSNSVKFKVQVKWKSSLPFA